MRRSCLVIALTAMTASAIGCGESRIVSTNSQSVGNGAQGGPTGSMSQGFAKFRACLTSHGAKLPSGPPPGGGSPGAMRGNFNPSDPAFRKAIEACRSEMPFRGGNGGPPQGPSGYPQDGAPGGTSPGGPGPDGFVPPTGGPPQ
jgi:hypothetical protein